MDEFSLSPALAVHQAVVLAAGNGDRFRNGSSRSKLLTLVGGVPLLGRTLASAFDAGISLAHIVLGYDADFVRVVAERSAPRGLALRFHLNRQWREENGLSVLAARRAVDHRPFALMMGDHIVEAAALRRLAHTPCGPDETLLCVDRQESDPATVAEATRVRLEGDRVRAIGKTLDPFDALDTGLFVCHAAIFDALEAACADGDTTLSGGVRRLAARGLVRGVDIGTSRWCDIDTTSDLAGAEHLVSSQTGR